MVADSINHSIDIVMSYEFVAVDSFNLYCNIKIPSVIDHYNIECTG